MSFTFILITIIFEFMFSEPDVNNRFFFNDGMQGNLFITTVRNFFYLFPSFPLSLCFGSILKQGAQHMDQAIFAWVEGQEVTWEDFSADKHGRMIDGLVYTMPSPLKSLGVMVQDIILFLLLTWYFDHIISHNRGVSEYEKPV